MDSAFVINCLETNSVDLLDGDVLNICRLCTVPIEEGCRSVADSSSMLKDENTGRIYLISEVIQQLINCNVAADDGLPQRICKNCFKQLYLAYNFIGQAKKIDRAFRSYLRANNPEVDEKKNEEVQTELVEHFNQSHAEEVVLEAIEGIEMEATDDPHESSIVDEDDERIEILLTDETEPEQDQEPEEKPNLIVRIAPPIKKPREKKQKLELVKTELLISDEKQLDSEDPEDQQENTKGFQCSYCQKFYSFPQSLNRHIKSAHKSSSTTLRSCTHCPRTFSRADDLVRHIRTHTNERPYCCNMCSKCFKQSSELKEHLRSHTKDSIFTCNVCQKELTTRQGYYAHMKHHEQSLLKTLNVTKPTTKATAKRPKDKLSF